MAKFLISIFSTVIQLVKTVITNIMLLKLRFKEIKQLAYISRRHWSYVPKSWALSFQSVQSLSRVQLFAAPWNAAGQASLSITNSPSLLKLISVELVMPSNHLTLCCALLLRPSIFPSIWDLSIESAIHIRWPKYCSFSISPSSKYSGLISLKFDWFDLLAVQGFLRSLLQHHSLKAPILWHSAFFLVQLSQPYVTAGKTIALTIWTFVRE